MSNRKYESGFEKLKKKRKIEKLIQSQKGALEKFVVTNKQSTTSSSTQEVETKQSSGELEMEQTLEIELEDDFERMPHHDVDNQNDELDEDRRNKDSVEVIETQSSISENIYDPGHWKNIDTKLRNLLVERGPIRDYDLKFPKDENNRHFSTIHYIRKLPNGEKYDRRWLVYSNDLYKVYCFCCKLFDSKPSTGQLVNEGTKD